MTLLASGYIVGAVILSLVVAYRGQARRQASRPGTRSYVWGCFFGCACLALCVPLAAASAVESAVAFSRERWAACHLHGACMVIFALTAVCGWFIMRRKGWAWWLGSLLAPVCAFPVLQDLLGWMVVNVGFVGGLVWAINYAYGRNRWGEFFGVASAPAARAEKAAELGIGNCQLPVAS